MTRKALTKVFWCPVSIINYNLLNFYVCSDTELSKEPSGKKNKASQEDGNDISKAEKEKCKKRRKRNSESEISDDDIYVDELDEEDVCSKIKKKDQAKQRNLTKCLWLLKKLEKNEKSVM